MLYTLTLTDGPPRTFVTATRRVSLGVGESAEVDLEPGEAREIARGHGVALTPSESTAAPKTRTIRRSGGERR